MSSISSTRTVTKAAPRAIRSRAKAQEGISSIVAKKMLLFLSVFVFVYFGASMGFQVMKESARTARIHAGDRALSARRATVGLENRVNYLSRPDRIEEWALSHGYIRQSVVPIPPMEGSLVALKD